MKFLLESSSTVFNNKNPFPDDARVMQKTYTETRHRLNDTITKEVIYYTIELANLEEVLNFIHECGNPIIVSKTNAGLGKYTIEIYDSYRE